MNISNFTFKINLALLPENPSTVIDYVCGASSLMMRIPAMNIKEDDQSVKINHFLDRYKAEIQKQTKYHDDDESFARCFGEKSKLFTKHKDIFTPPLTDFQDQFELNQIFATPKDVKFYLNDGNDNELEWEDDDDTENEVGDEEDDDMGAGTDRKRETAEDSVEIIE